MMFAQDGTTVYPTYQNVQQHGSAKWRAEELRERLMTEQNLDSFDIWLTEAQISITLTIQR